MGLPALILTGAAIGLATGLLPGLHVNTLAALAMAVLPVLGPDAALGLVAVGTVHTIVNILPGTYLGVPDEEGLVALPAHRMLLEGRGPAAVRVSVQASLAALVVAALAGPLYGRLLGGWFGSLIDAWAPWIIATVALTLIAQEADRGLAAIVGAIAVFIGSGLLGVLSMQVPLQPLVPVPASPLLPLLGGLFGGASLLAALKAPTRLPVQRPHGREVAVRRPVASGLAVSACTAVLAGLTAAVATALVPRDRHDDPARTVATMSAINTGHAVLALHVVLLDGTVRTGLADVVARGMPGARWLSHAPTVDATHLLAVVLAAGALGAVGTLALDRVLAPQVHWLPARTLSVAGLSFLATLMLTLTGWTGLLLGATATVVGLVPLAAGLRRVHLVGALLVPILLRQTGWLA